jgi:hypothetical protein
MCSGCQKRFDMRPEAGFAGREAKRTPVGSATQREGAHGGTMGSPTPNARDVGFLDV